ncbi:hypothetical protein MUP35_02360 [Patescibacteria group bacterium]|nr:hypothetical protein [Patescibacteria group bacterium]
MRNKLLIVFSLLFFLLFLWPAKAKAETPDLNYPNNKIGIHLAIPSFEDLEKAAALVNANGDWGYVTLVMQEDDLNKEKWQGVFDQARRLHLIPIIRLATSFENGHWRAPKANETQKWADFLNSLNWVVKNRFVVLFNESNRADEWGGKVNPQDFAEVVFSFSKSLKSINPDFFVMMAGFDSAAPSSSPQYEDEAVFLRKALASQKNLFDYLDGWASHSYPKSNFSYGRNSVSNYQWELNLIKSLGVTKNLPVFITETGWCHQEGKIVDFKFISQEKAVLFIRNYLLEVSKDTKVIAVTPFILNYQEEPFDHYSWQKNDNEFYPQYETVQQMNKVKGKPFQEEKLVLRTSLPEKLIKDSTYQMGLIIRNEGQGFWDQKDGYVLKLEGLPDDASYFFSDFSTLMPFEEKPIWLYLKTGEKLGKSPLKLVLVKNNQVIGNQIEWNLEIVPETSIKMIAKLLFKRKTEGNDFKFLVYNQNEEIVYSLGRFTLKNGEAEIKDIKNLIIGDKYRLVLIKPFYLPRQTFLKIEEENNQAVFKALLPFDFNQDGQFSFKDLWTLLRRPKLFKLWWLN